VLVPALNVKPVDVKFIGEPPDSVTADDPRLIERVFVPRLCKLPLVKAKFPVEKLPLKTANPYVVNPTVSAEPSVQPPPIPSNARNCEFPVPMVTPFVLMVFPVVVAQNVSCWMEDQVSVELVAVTVMFPYMESLPAPEPAIVRAPVNGPAIDISAQAAVEHTFWEPAVWLMFMLYVPTPPVPVPREVI
jgi:hypothetical protein